MARKIITKDAPPIIRTEAFAFAGPPGRDGNDGTPGRDGRDAIAKDGEPGVSFNWLGEYISRRRYKPLDCVRHENASWVAIRESQNREPGEASAYWDLLVVDGRAGRDGERGGAGQRGRKGADGETIVIERGQSVPAIFDSAALTGDVVYASGDGRVDLSIADGEPQTLAIGMAIADVGSGMAGNYATHGLVENPSWNLIPGAVYYLDGSVAGGMTDVYPTTIGHFVVILGAALSETEFNLNIHWANYIAA